VKRPLKPDELKIWGVVVGTVHPLPGRATPAAPATAEAAAADSPAHVLPVQAAAVQTRSAKPLRQAIEPIEPNRRHRIVREREEIAARLDLHGYDQDRARAVLEAFLRRAWDDGYRAVLVITGKGVQGDGVLRRRTPEWLAAPHLASMVAGVSEAHRRHGGAGALYVALKRRPRG
jgi:DNA-nicking Smr family endonuclease